MESLKKLYKIGRGPSSSHTMGPHKAAGEFLNRCPEAHRYEVSLYGSLAATGKGHLTDKIIEEVFSGKSIHIIWKPDELLSKHPNALKFEAFDEKNKKLTSWTSYSIGGGDIIDEHTAREKSFIYPLSTMNEILSWCHKNGKQLWEYIELYEDNDIWDYLENIWAHMQQSIKHGLDSEGTLPGGLKLARKASHYYQKAQNFRGQVRRRGMLYAFALAVSEENASGGEVVTAPTCGASGTLPAVLEYHKIFNKQSKDKILKALATAGLFGNIVKHNASISGAEVGCQGEVGTACAMASAATTRLFGGTNHQIEYAAEIGIEHHLGLTCDPLLGLVQIPCIERNVFAAARSLNHGNFALLSDGRHHIKFDEAVTSMNSTGQDLSCFYKETSRGGLALLKGLAE